MPMQQPTIYSRFGTGRVLLSSEQAIASVYAFQELLHNEQNIAKNTGNLNDLQGNTGNVLSRLDDVKKSGSEIYKRLHEQVQKYIDNEKQSN